MTYKVAIVTNSPSGGGAERSMNQLGNHLSDKGLTVTKIYVKPGQEDLVKSRQPEFTLLSNEKRIFNSLYAVVAFNKLLRVIKPDVIILNCDFPEFLGVFLLRDTNLIVVEHTLFPFAKRRLVGRFIRIILLLRKSVFVSVSEMEQVWPLGLKFTSVIENLNQYPDRNLILRECPISRLVFIGRLSDEKKPFDALRIAHLSRTSILCIGTGSLQKSLEAFARNLSIDAEFMGQVLNPWAFLKPGDILIVTSEYEGDGLVLIEGMAAGVPIIANDVPSLRRFNLPENNYAVSDLAFVERILAYRENSSDLIPPKECFDQIEKSRNSDFIVEKWRALICGDNG